VAQRFIAAVKGLFSDRLYRMLKNSRFVSGLPFRIRASLLAMPFFKIRRPFRGRTSKTGIFQQRDYPPRKNSNFSTNGKGTSLLVPLSPWKMCPRFSAGGVLSAASNTFSAASVQSAEKLDLDFDFGWRSGSSLR